MSRIFTFPALVAGHVPDEDDFADAKELLKTRLAGHPEVYGAVLFGSALGNNQSRASDLDVFIVLANPDPLKSLEMMRGVTAAVRECFVPLESIICTVDSLKSNQHALQPGLVTHLHWAAAHGGIIGQDSRKLLFESSPSWAEATDYALHARDKLTRWAVKWTVLTENERNRARAAALDKPVHAARKFLAARHGKEVAGWSSAQVVAAFKKNTSLTEIARRKHAYHIVLSDQLKDANEQTYEMFLDSLDATIFVHALDFLNHIVNALAWHSSH